MPGKIAPEKRIPAWIALWLELLNGAIERHVLMLAVAPRNIPTPPQQLPECRVAPQIGANDHRVGKKADQALGPNSVATRDNRTYHNVVLPCVARE